MNKGLHELIKKYESDRDYYLTDRYNETLLRNDFLDPLFELLGWDIKNRVGRPTNKREVILEEPFKAGASENTKKPVVQIGENSYRLKFAAKKQLLTNCIYGVDKDFNAAEACKSGLLLKLLENEDSVSLMKEHPILPNLAPNIHYGNSLLSSNDIKAINASDNNLFDMCIFNKKNIFLPKHFEIWNKYITFAA